MHHDTDHPVRRNLGTGQQYWRSLDELAQTPAFEEMLHREFPDNASEWLDAPSRRTFLKLMGASLALGGVGGCWKQPEEKILPYVQPPEEIVPGKPVFYATAMPLGGYGYGVLAESHEGRPTKIEGNPDHPASRGATNVFMQASVLTLWDPDRAQSVTRLGQPSSWPDFLAAVEPVLAQLRKTGGAGLAILAEPTTSPTLLDQFEQVRQMYPQAGIYTWDPGGNDGASAGAEMAFGQPLRAIYRLDRAKRILSLDANFLYDDPASLIYARQFIDQRRMWFRVPGHTPPASAEQANRLYMIQSTPTITGAMADHRLIARASEVEGVARAVARELGVDVQAPAVSGDKAKWIAAMAADLRAHGRESLVLAGENQPPFVHALAHAINATLSSQCVQHIESPLKAAAPIGQLVEQISAGKVSTLLILSSNPVFTAPADLNFKQVLKNFAEARLADGSFRNLVIHHSLYYDETSFLSHWHVPESHYLENWSDIRAFDGSASIIQPLVAPLYGSRSAHEMLAVLLGNWTADTSAPVQDFWQRQMGLGFRAGWNAALQRGVVENSAAAPVVVSINQQFLRQAPSQAGGEIEVMFRPDPSIGDGRFANNGWLQELPRPFSKVTWDNPALVSAATAQKLGVSDGRVLRINVGGQSVDVPVWVMPGHPDDAITCYFGAGRERAGLVGTASEESGGVNVYPLRTSGRLWFTSATASVVRAQHKLASTQGHFQMEGRDLVRERPLDVFLAHIREPGRTTEHHPIHLSLYPEYDYTQQHRWAMQIDLNACIGCNACVVACQSENNVPVVGKDQVLNTREMHWLRIDTYFEGPVEDPQAVFQPVPCMHCEKAPCEVVCPVAATTHSAEGLNEMTYNRCVGTRYCSNNCPYKVRRFNFLTYSRTDPPQLMLQKNPDVTVRQRGVMEKCTYCVQRINRTRIELKKLDGQVAQLGTDDARQRARQLGDALMDQLQTACQQACPTEAIVFGDLNHRSANGTPSTVALLREQPHTYWLLPELNTQPRTTYLERFRNPNPQLSVAREGVTVGGGAH